MSDPTETYLTPEELEARFGIAKATQARKRCHGELPYRKFGRRVLYRWDEIVQLIEASGTGAKAAR
jgi:hypothetical protein